MSRSNLERPLYYGLDHNHLHQENNILGKWVKMVVTWEICAAISMIPMLSYNIIRFRISFLGVKRTKSRAIASGA
nr:hypothetical protein [Tanacetum cinerariifolium]